MGLSHLLPVLQSAMSVEISDKKVEFLGEDNSKAVKEQCNNCEGGRARPAEIQRSGNPEQKICKTEAQVFLYLTRASIAYYDLPNTNENIISDKQSQ